MKLQGGQNTPSYTSIHPYPQLSNRLVYHKRHVDELSAMNASDGDDNK